MSSPPPSLTLTSLLSSLHSHLQLQTQLLPTLHIQLGLPPNALEDELRTIQQQLMQSVEAQIDTRKKEVELWLEKCDTVENECIQYAKALGGNVKSTGSSVGELRKEQVLPRRYELVSVHQEKLRQMYHTKLEQLMTLTTRLKNLSRILGPDFYSEDTLSPTPSDGDTKQSTSLRNVTPERFSKLEKELVRGKSEVAKRLSQLASTLLQIDWLYAELGIPPPSPDSFPFPTHMKMRSTSSASSSTVDPFLSASLSTPTPASRRPPAPMLFVTPEQATQSALSDMDCQGIFARFVARIEEADETTVAEGATFALEGVDPHPSLLRWAEHTRTELEDKKRRREAYIQTMYDQLEALWRRLGVSDSDMDAFVDAHKGSTEVTVRAYEDELERMLELKRERMGVFIGNAREEIVKLWDDLMVGEEEKLDFAPFADDEHTEELLAIHEDEIRRLKEERRRKGSLLASIKKYFEICDEEKELATAASDQTRLLGRGVRGDPGRLLREEKMRKRVNKEKPRLEQDLLSSIPAWEKQAGHRFLVYGESILKMLMETVSAAEPENNNNNARKHGSMRSVSTRSVTPQYVPGQSASSSRNIITPAVRPPSRLDGSSSKRARLGDSVGTKPPSSGGSAPIPLGVNRAYGNVTVSRPASPTGKGKKPPSSSSLPRPARLGTGGGHARAVSNGSVLVYGVGGGAVVVDSAVVSKKATRARKESFRPRPSVDTGPGARYRGD